MSWKHFKDALLKKRRQPVGASDANYFDHQNGIFTNYYPHESLPIPDNGRYRLHNEIEDCIVCDKCAKVCPVNCIDIEAIKSTEEIRKASDGSSIRLHAAKFDIDMAKCCYCGLCTTVCPTECLTMTKTFDYSEFDIRNMVYEFSEMTPAEAQEKRDEYNTNLEAKKAIKEAAPSADVSSSAKPKVVIPGAKKAATAAAPKPKIPGAGALKPKIEAKPSDRIEPEKSAALKPKIGGAKPSPLKPVIKKAEGASETKQPSPLKPVIKKPSEGANKPSALKPVIKKPADADKKPSALKPVIKKKTDDQPKPSALKPVIKKTENTSEVKKPSALKPVMKKPTTDEDDQPKKPSVLKPVIKPKPPKSEDE